MLILAQGIEQKPGVLNQEAERCIRTDRWCMKFSGFSVILKHPAVCYIKGILTGWKEYYDRNCSSRIQEISV
jgi:hypothetical protein